MRYQRGFTLIELIVVMVVIATVFAFIGINAGSGAKQFEIKKISKRIYANMLFAQEESILRGKPLGLNIREVVEFNNEDFKQEHYYELQWLILEFEKEAEQETSFLTLNQDEDSDTVVSAEGKSLPARKWKLLEEDVLKPIQVPVEYLNLELTLQEQTVSLNAEDQEDIFEREKFSLDSGDDAKDEDSKEKIPKPLIYFLPNGELFDFQLTMLDASDDEQGFVIVGDSGGSIEYAFVGEEQLK